MVKPMTMTIQVDVEAFGKVFRMLDGTPGVVDISLHGSGPKKERKKPQPNGGDTIQSVILRQLINSGRSMRTSEFYPAIEAAGRSSVSTSDALTRMKKLGFIKRRNGIVSITAKGRQEGGEA